MPFSQTPGVLIECDPSIKSIIVNIDSDNHDFIIEDLDEERVVVKENMVPLLKQKLEDVRSNLPICKSIKSSLLTLVIVSQNDTPLTSIHSASRKTSRPSTSQVPNNHKNHNLPFVHRWPHQTNT